MKFPSKKRKEKVKKAKFQITQEVKASAFKIEESDSQRAYQSISLSLERTKKKNLGIKGIGIEKRYEIVSAIYLTFLKQKEELEGKISFKELEAKSNYEKEVEGIIKEKNDRLQKIEENYTLINDVPDKKEHRKTLDKLEKKRDRIVKENTQRVTGTKLGHFSDIFKLKKKLLKLTEETRKEISNCLSSQIIAGAELRTFLDSFDEDEETIMLASKITKKIGVKGDTLTLLENVSFKINKGEIVAIMGKSGSGKTTLLNILCGIDYASTGDIIVDGMNINYLTEADQMTFRKRNISTVFQGYNLLPNLTVYDNVKVGTRFSETPPKKREILHTLDVLGLTEFKNKMPGKLSGGQKQRVAIARAILKKPKILFCDEPTAALDQKTGRKIIESLKSLNKEYNITIILVTHTPWVAREADKVIEIENKTIKSVTKTNKQLKEIPDLPIEERSQEIYIKNPIGISNKKWEHNNLDENSGYYGKK